MSSTDVGNAASMEAAGLSTIDMALEVVTLPVSDVDRAKRFYQSLGWRMDIDLGRQRRHPDGAGHAAPLSVLDPVRQGRHNG